MYKPPENTNRVKTIKSKFENQDSLTKTPTKIILRKSRTLQDIKVKSTTNTNSDAIIHQQPQTHPTLCRQLSDSSKRNIKRTPAFRLDKNLSPSKTADLYRNRTRYLDKVNKSNSNDIENSNFSNIRNKFNGNHQNEADQISNTINFLYTEPLPKSQRTKQDDTTLTPPKTLEPPPPPQSIHDACTLKISESKSQNGPHVGTGLTDTLKNALKKPLPKGPAPKKPPRTFVHSPKPEPSPESTPLSLNKDFTKKLNIELQRNITNSLAKTKTKGDPKYMLDKLETALKMKGVLVRKITKTDTGSEEDESDCERNKIKLPLPRDLPDTPLCYTSPPSSPKFNLNCLPSLSCGTSMYEVVKESKSSFFVECKKEEPVYAEPFEYYVDVEKSVASGLERDDAINDGDTAVNNKTIRHSVHYASSPVPDVNMGDIGNYVSEVKSQDQVARGFDSTPTSSTSTSDMDSVLSTPSEENKTLLSNIKVKDLIKAIESNNPDKTKIHKTFSNPNVTATNSLRGKSTYEDRVQKSQSLSKNALDRRFSSSSQLSAHSESNISEASFTEEDAVNKREAKKFETYVRGVRSKSFYKSRWKKENLFHCCLLVALDRCTPYVKSKFPQAVQEPYRFADLCFPEIENGPMDTSVEAQCYSLIITNELGERTFGYCRRVLPEASTTCLPLAYCILSKHRAPGFYRRVLEELEYRHGYPDKFRDAFIEELYNCKFPMPGETMVIDCSKIIVSSGCDKVRNNSTNKSFYCDKQNVVNNRKTDEDNELDLNSYVIVCNSGEYGTLIRNNGVNQNKLNGTRVGSAIINSIPREMPSSNLKKSSSSPNLLADIEPMPSELVLMRPLDARHEENDLKLLGQTLKVPVLQKIFCSLLLERKVILASSMLSKLSSCIEALQIILYPFSWQHAIIPVLPRSLWEIVDTPTPLLCGVLSTEITDNYNIENAIVIDLDEGAILQQVGDEDRILPTCLINTLKDGLNVASTIASNNSGAHNIFLSDAFLRIFICTCGHYKNFIFNGNFKKAEFIQHSRHKGRRIRQFLKWFTETTMFYNFIEVALSNSSNLDLFDQRIEIYSSVSATEILNKMKYWTSYRGIFSSSLIRFQ